MFQKVIELIRIHVAGAWVYVDEYRGGADLGDGFGGGDKGVGHGDDFVTRPDACCHERKAQGVGAGVDAHAETGSAEFGEGLFKAVDVRSADEGGILQCFGDHRQDFGYNRPVLGLEVEERDFHRLFRVT